MKRIKYIRSHKDEVDNTEALEKKPKYEDTVNFGKMQSKIGCVDSLDNDGFPFIGANLQNGDIVIGKCVESRVDHSIKLKHTERGTVQKVVLSANDDGKNFAVVSLRQCSNACLSDKFSSMHGQKGAGFSRWGNERVYKGRTGEMIHSLVFMGPTCYQSLTHMSEVKVKFRNTGPVHPLTKQPVADKKRFGGIKFGEMERDCLIAHGAATNLHERLFTLSDSSQMHIYRKCKNIANVIQRPVPGSRKITGPYCRFCESVEDIVRVNVPYGAKLLCQELFSMGISLKFDNEVF
ncbi:unnamed protein product [Camellia sinensis]